MKKSQTPNIWYGTCLEINRELHNHLVFPNCNFRWLARTIFSNWFLLNFSFSTDAALTHSRYHRHLPKTKKVATSNPAGGATEAEAPCGSSSNIGMVDEIIWIQLIECEILPWYNVQVTCESKWDGGEIDHSSVAVRWSPYCAARSTRLLEITCPMTFHNAW